MDLLAIIRIALRALARNKMRSSLTMLGIIIGVGAVIAMVGVGQGAQEAVQQQIAAMGSNVLMVGSGTINRGALTLLCIVAIHHPMLTSKVFLNVLLTG